MGKIDYIVYHMIRKSPCNVRFDFYYGNLLRARCKYEILLQNAAAYHMGDTSRNLLLLNDLNGKKS